MRLGFVLALLREIVGAVVELVLHDRGRKDPRVPSIRPQRAERKRDAN